MLNIALCDDENYEIEYLRRLIKKWNNDTQVSAFTSAESLLFQYNNSFDIVLLDIQMKGMDGVALAREIRKLDTYVQLVFITAYPDFMSEGYEVDALHYLIKPVHEEKLYEVLERAVCHLNKPVHTVLLNISGDMVRVRVDEITYAEAFDHYITIYTPNKNYRTKMSLSELERLLGDGFFRCNRSFLVGMKYVGRVSKNTIILDSGNEIPLSRNLYDEANRAFIEYY